MRNEKSAAFNSCVTPSHIISSSFFTETLIESNTDTENLENITWKYNQSYLSREDNEEQWTDWVTKSTNTESMLFQQVVLLKMKRLAAFPSWWSCKFLNTIWNTNPKILPRKLFRHNYSSLFLRYFYHNYLRITRCPALLGPQRMAAALITHTRLWPMPSFQVPTGGNVIPLIQPL